MTVNEEKEESQPTMVKTVKFNVGGSHYEVSRSLLDQYPDSMLFKIASDTWIHAGSGDPEEPIFIERNGTRFEYVLDYMRDNRVCLPQTVPRSQFVLDMEYYGLELQDDHVTLSVDDHKAVFCSVVNLRHKLKSEMKEIDTAGRTWLAKKLACDVALQYFRSLAGHDSDPVDQPVDLTISLPDKYTTLGTTLLGTLFTFTPSDIQGHLGTMGLKVHSVERTYQGHSLEINLGAA